MKNKYIIFIYTTNVFYEKNKIKRNEKRKWGGIVAIRCFACKNPHRQASFIPFFTIFFTIYLPNFRWISKGRRLRKEEEQVQKMYVKEDKEFARQTSL